MTGVEGTNQKTAELYKEIKEAYLDPYQDFEVQVKELLSMMNAPLDEIKTFVFEMKERDKAAKRRENEAYFFRRNGALGGLAVPVSTDRRRRDLRLSGGPESRGPAGESLL